MDAQDSRDGLSWLDPDARANLGVTGSSRELPNLARQSTLRDPATGAVWRRRGSQRVPENRLHRLLADPRVRVLHDYLGRVDEVLPAQRVEFLSKTRAAMAQSEHSDFYAVEFQDDHHAHLLVVHEDC